MSKGIANLPKRLPELLETARDELPASLCHLVARLIDHLKELGRQMDELEDQIKAWHRSCGLSRKLEKIPGIGPRQHSSGGKPMLLRISKRGDACMRTLLIHGARSAILAAQ